MSRSDQLQSNTSVKYVEVKLQSEIVPVNSEPSGSNKHWTVYNITAFLNRLDTITKCVT